MRKLRLFLLLALLIAPLAFTAAKAQSPVEVRIMWYDDGNEGKVLRAQLDQFEKDNPDIKVIVDTVPYTTIQEQLPLQVQAGKGPDMARVTDLPGLVGKYLDLRPLLKDAKTFEDYFPPILLQSMRPAGDDKGLYGFPNQFTVTGPYINRTLFKQAGIDVPSDSKKDVTWQEWTDVSVKVAKATNTKYAIAMDRSGHRFSGPALSMGATLLDDKGKVTIDTPGFRAMAQIFLGWFKDGITPAEVWVGSGGSYAAAADQFINGQLVFYMSGSWQIQRFSTDIGTKFDWEAVPNPSGPGGSTGMPGGTGVVAFAATQHPKETARVMEYLASEKVLGDFSAQTLFIPGHLGLAKSGVKYVTDSAAAQKALNAFLSEVPKIKEQGYLLNAYKYNSVLFNAIRDRLTQVITSELTLDDAIKRMQDDVDKATAGTK
jgi:alpha-1,4-digalacturonate transport system substrate-binding protein